MCCRLRPGRPGRGGGRAHSARAHRPAEQDGGAARRAHPHEPHARRRGARLQFRPERLAAAPARRAPAGLHRRVRCAEGAGAERRRCGRDHRPHSVRRADEQRRAHVSHRRGHEGVSGSGAVGVQRRRLQRRRLREHHQAERRDEGESAGHDRPVRRRLQRRVQPDGRAELRESAQRRHLRPADDAPRQEHPQQGAARHPHRPAPPPAQAAPARQPVPALQRRVRLQPAARRRLRQLRRHAVPLPAADARAGGAQRDLAEGLQPGGGEGVAATADRQRRVAAVVHAERHPASRLPPTGERHQRRAPCTDILRDEIAAAYPARAAAASRTVGSRAETSGSPAAVRTQLSRTEVVSDGDDRCEVTWRERCDVGRDAQLRRAAANRLRADDGR